PRAIETAQIVGEAFGAPEIVTDCDLCEVHPGDVIDGMTWEAYAKEYRGDDFVWDPFVAWGPGVETWAEFSFRTSRRLRQVALDHPGETVVVACHGGVIRASMQAFGGLPLTQPFRLEPSNTSLTEWRYQPTTGRSDAGNPAWWLVRYNDAAHLADL